MKKIVALIFVLGVFAACNKDDESTDSPIINTDTDTEINPFMSLVIQGDTIRTDSVYTRFMADGRYQIAAVDTLGRMVLLNIFNFLGEALYTLGPSQNPSNPYVINKMQLRSPDGSFLSGTAYEGYINVTDYSTEEKRISGSFGGSLIDPASPGETVVIDTAYFENVLPIVLNTEPGRADLFFNSELFRNLESTAVLSSTHHLNIASVEKPIGDGFSVWVTDATPTEQTRSYFIESGLCFLSNPYYDILPVSLDSASQTVSGELRAPLFDTYVYFNEVPVEFPDFPIQSDQLNLRYNGETLFFEEYLIQTSAEIGFREVTFSALSSSGAYLEGSMENTFTGDPFDCGSLFYESSLELYESEGAAVPIATFEGMGNLTSSNTSQTTAEMGFTSDEAELSGINLDVIWVE